MQKLIVVAATLALGATGVEAQARATTQPARPPLSVSQRNTDYRCVDDRGSYERDRALFERRLREEHDYWHRVNDRLLRADFVRQHEAFHQRLDRSRAEWERNYRGSRRCDYRFDNDQRGHGYDNSGRYDNRLERERDRFRDKVDRRDDYDRDRDRKPRNRGW